MILRRLKKYFKEFYDENKNMIIFATMGLTISLLIRGIIDNLRYFSVEVNKHIIENENIYNAFLLVFCDIIPICF